MKAESEVDDAIFIRVHGRGLAGLRWQLCMGAVPHNNRVHPPAGALSCEHGCSLRPLRARRG